MAVYTHLQHDELTALSQAYGLGMLQRAMPIAEGVENSNYLLEYIPHAGGNERCILTIYEKRIDVTEIPFYLALMEHLSQKNMAVPRPLRRLDGEYISPVRETKRAAMVTFLNGKSVTAPQAHHLQALGHTIAKLHAAVSDFALMRENNLAFAGWQRLFDAIASRAEDIAPGLAQAVETELNYLASVWPHELAKGVVHADLFPDNVFFEGKRLSGVIDWYFACTDAFLYDLIIAMNAWCFDGQGAFSSAHAGELLSAYHVQRPIIKEERAVLPILARGAALRFLLTRAYDWLNRQEGALVNVKNPLEYYRKLVFHQSVTDAGSYGL
jgi:homoserine kinase type II